MSFLEQVESHLRDRVAPCANLLDSSVYDLSRALTELGEHRWLGLKIPAERGGNAVSAIEFQQFQELLAQYSGALAFLQAQHQSAGGFLSRSDNEALKQDYLPLMSTGEVAVGVGFSHLRRPVSPLRALPVTGGFVLDGTIPWITGYGLFQAFIGAAVLPDHQALYGLLPFCNSHQANGGQIHFSDPMALAALSSTSTVTAECQQWFLPSSQVVFVKPANAIHLSDRQNVLQHSFYALGCARAALNLIEQIGQTRSQKYIHQTYQVLDRELRQCRDAIYADAENAMTTRVQLRAWAIELAGRCAHVAVTLSAGMANSLTHPAQRIYREAMVFTVTGQTSAVMAATVQRLIQRPTVAAQIDDNYLEIDASKT